MSDLPRSLSLFLIFLASLVFVACSDDGGATDTTTGNDVTATAPAASEATATAPATTGASEAAIQGTITVDFTGAPEENDPIEVTFEVAPDTTAWEAVMSVLGEDRLTFEDFGGDLGVFISGFDGVEVEGNNFWEFRVNGEGSELGVSQYVVQQGDVLEFVYSSF